jgi:hypothetical protein
VAGNFEQATFSWSAGAYILKILEYAVISAAKGIVIGAICGVIGAKICYSWRFICPRGKQRTTIILRLQ